MDSMSTRIFPTGVLLVWSSSKVGGGTAELFAREAAPRGLFKSGATCELLLITLIISSSIRTSSFWNFLFRAGSSVSFPKRFEDWFS